MMNKGGPGRKKEKFQLKRLTIQADADELRRDVAPHASLRVVEEAPDVVVCYGGDGTLLSHFTIVPDAPIQILGSDVAYSSVQDEYLVVYTYTGSGAGWDVMARRITWNGADLNLPPYQEFRVGRPDASGEQHRPAVTYNENNDEYLVVWQVDTDLNANDINAAMLMIAEVPRRVDERVECRRRNLQRITGLDFLQVAHVPIPSPLKLPSS